VLVDTGVWTWVRDRRFPQLATWFNAAVADGLVLVCDLVVLGLVRLAPNADRAASVARRLDGFEPVPMSSAWDRARTLQQELAQDGVHRSVPPADLLIAAAAEQAEVPLIHYDRDYTRIAAVAPSLDARWFVPDGALA
jgi:predicted nucleic acid-binding protein